MYSCSGPQLVAASQQLMQVQMAMQAFQAIPHPERLDAAMLRVGSAPRLRVHMHMHRVSPMLLRLHRRGPLPRMPYVG
jgi:hypothetical protein